MSDTNYDPEIAALLNEEAPTPAPQPAKEQPEPEAADSFGSHLEIPEDFNKPVSFEGEDAAVLKEIKEALEDEETVEVNEDGEVVEEDPNRVHLEMNPAIMDRKSKWAILAETLGKVGVTDVEKDVFFKATLFDTPFYTTIELMGGKVKVYCVDHTKRDEELIGEAIKLDFPIGENGTSSFTITALEDRLFAYRIYLHVQNINNVPLVADAKPIDYTKPTLEQAKILSANVDRMLETMAMAKWEVLTTSVKVLHAKLQILTENVLNKDFWNPVDIS